MKKVPAITLLFWVMKICATTLGETAGDLLSMTLNVGYAISTLVLLAIFGVTLLGQLSVRKYIPVLYWAVILSTSTAGTTLSDYMDRTLKLGYATGATILSSLLVLVLAVWYWIEKSLSVTDIKTGRPEVFYWTAILVSNTLGTALGDFLADNSGLGFAGGAELIGGALVLVVLAHYFTNIASVVLFWIAFVLTRPFGATLDDLLTKTPDKGGLGFGTIGASTILVVVLAGLIIYTSVRLNRSLPTT